MSKTHCVHGHEYTPENTAVNNRGQIFCRICSRIKAQRYKAQNPDVVKAHRAKYKARAEEQAKPKRRVETRAAGGKAVLHYNDGVEAERAAIVAWLRKNAELNPHLPDARALVLLFSKAIEDGAHHEGATT
jgi:hypothetical protein